MKPINNLISHHTSPLVATSSSFSISLPSVPVAVPFLNPKINAVSHPSPEQRSIKHIPKSSRSACANLLSSLLDSIVDSPQDASHWQVLLDFGFNILRCPVRGGHRNNLSSTILKRIRGAPASSDTAHVARKVSHKLNVDALRASAVSAKVEAGNISAAVRILCSDDTPAEFSEETDARLLEKHPTRPPGPSSLPPSDHFSPFQATFSDVRKAVTSFPPGSGAGSDSLRPQHILEMISTRHPTSCFQGSVIMISGISSSGAGSSLSIKNPAAFALSTSVALGDV